MKCLDLFERVVPLWPASVELDADGVKKLRDHYQKQVEAKIDHHGDPWLDIGAWAFNQSLWNYLDSELARGSKSLCPSHIPIALFHKNMLSNLSHESWAQERGEYER